MRAAVPGEGLFHPSNTTTTTMNLKNKNAVIYGVGDSLGGAVARALAAAGATVFLTARRRANAAKVAEAITAAGGRAEADEVDALDEVAVRGHADHVASKAGTLDVSFNLIGIDDLQGVPLVQMSLADFVRPVEIAMRSQFLTATTAGRIMSRQRSGVILTLTATPGGIGCPHVGGFGPACCAIEALSRNLATELGPDGVRVVNIRSAGSPDSRPFLNSPENGGDVVHEWIEKIKTDTMLKQLPAMEDIAHAAVFLASDLAGKITGVTLDITVGTTTALNYMTGPTTSVQR
jgi:NAD(P)-dependent dehydrogenase (short-subunit alcohol dehydrogenase family)